MVVPLRAARSEFTTEAWSGLRPQPKRVFSGQPSASQLSLSTTSGSRGRGCRWFAGIREPGDVFRSRQRAPDVSPSCGASVTRNRHVDGGQASFGFRGIYLTPPATTGSVWGCSKTIRKPRWRLSGGLLRTRLAASTWLSFDGRRGSFVRDVRGERHGGRNGGCGCAGRVACKLRSPQERSFRTVICR